VGGRGIGTTHEQRLTPMTDGYRQQPEAAGRIQRGGLGARQRRGCRVRSPSTTHLFGAARRADKQIVLEVLEQRDAHCVRGIALTPTQGLARGMAWGQRRAAEGAGRQRNSLRMFDVFGSVIDRGAAVSDVPMAFCAPGPPPLADDPPSRRSSRRVSRLSMSCAAGARRQGGTLRRGGVGKTVLLTEMIHNMVGH